MLTGETTFDCVLSVSIHWISGVKDGKWTTGLDRITATWTNDDGSVRHQGEFGTPVEFLGHAIKNGLPHPPIEVEQEIPGAR